MARQIQGSQHDFSFGEVDPELKRFDEHPARKAGLRQMSNARILNSNGVSNRPGKSALFQNANNCTRTEKFTISAGNDFTIGFAAARLEIRNTAGAIVGAFVLQGGGAGLPWSAVNTDQIVWCLSQSDKSLTITFPGMRPQVVSWDGVSTWSIADYTELVLNGQKRTIFSRISPQGITLLPGARTGAGVSLVASQPLFVTGPAGHINTRMRFVGRQMLITAVANSTNATVTIMEALPGHQNLPTATDPRLIFSIGDVITGATSNSKGLITAISVGSIDVQLLSNNATVNNAPVSQQGPPAFRILGQTIVQDNQSQTQTFAFIQNETVVGPGGSIVVTTVSAIDNPTIGVPVWDEEVMNSLRGFPTSCFADQYRQGFCGFPAVPGGIAWSAINAPTDLYVGSNPSEAMFERVPGKNQVYHVIAGPESSEFVFCDNKSFYIKIDASNPLKPGSVSFQLLSSDGCSRVQPRVSQELILYVNAGGRSVMAILASGAYYRPFNTRNLCEFHTHLFNNIKEIAVPTADGDTADRYVYIMNGDNTLVVGRYDFSDVSNAGVVKVGWGPWSGDGSLQWVAAWNADVIFTSFHQGVAVCEQLDESRHMDFCLDVNNLPAAFTPSPGQGPLALFAGKTVTLMDQVTRVLGDYQVDNDGNIVPQNNGGENLLAASLVAGFAWTMQVEPFAPNAQSGADVGQRMKKRTIAEMAAYVMNSTGFIMANLFSGRKTPTSPAAGTVVTQRIVPSYNVDDVVTDPPPLRETVESFNPSGDSYDPRAAIIKINPGPLLIAEIGMEISI